MGLYLVDYENVNASGLMGINELGKNDTVYIFYTDSASTLSFAAHKMINDSPAAVNYMYVESGRKNALDFQLSSYFGFLVAAHGEDAFYIVSNDAGFNHVISFWKKNKIRAELVSNLTGQSKSKELEKINAQVTALIPQYAEDVETVVEYFDKYKTKQGFNNALLKKYGNKKTSEIYKAVKPLLKDKKGND